MIALDEGPYFQILCPKCNHLFIPRSITRLCPLCKNILPEFEQQLIIKVMPPKEFCWKCGHEWQPLPGKHVTHCPECNSYRWREPRKRAPNIDRYRGRYREYHYIEHGCLQVIIAPYSVLI